MVQPHQMPEKCCLILTDSRAGDFADCFIGVDSGDPVFLFPDHGRLKKGQSKIIGESMPIRSTRKP